MIGSRVGPENRVRRRLTFELRVSQLARSILVALALSALLATGVAAQSTGSSFGGGDWGGGGGSGSSGGGGTSGSSGSGYSGVSYDDPNAYEPPYGVQCLIAVAFLGLLVVGFRVIARASAPRAERIDVARARIAVDARARAFLQTTLRDLGRHGDTATSAGRAELLKATCGALRAAKLAWIYGDAKSFDPMPAAQAQSEFKRLADDARAGFQHELERASDGQRATTTVDEPSAREHEGAGAVLVSVLVASRRALVDVRGTRASELDVLLEQLGSLMPNELVAMEVVWTPSADGDRMSTAELEARYPSLTKLEGAIGGRVFCASCRGPYAAELPRCPHCGAPAA